VLGLWVRIPLETLMSLAMYSILVYIAALRWADAPVQGVLPTKDRIKQSNIKGVDPLIIMNR
jgi:hypothetical protein